MNNLVLVNHAVNGVMQKYLSERKYGDAVSFESKMMISQDSVLFTLVVTKGILRDETFKAVFPSKFICSCTEDNAVNLICGMFKNVLSECDKLVIADTPEFENDPFQDEVKKTIAKYTK